VTTSAMTLAWMYLGGARGALRVGDRLAAIRFLAAAARERRRAMATLEVICLKASTSHQPCRAEIRQPAARPRTLRSLV